MHARHLVWIGLFHAAFVVGCGTRPMPLASAGGAAAAPVRPSRPPAVKFEEPGAYSDNAYAAKPHTGPMDPDQLRKTIEGEVSGYEAPVAGNRNRKPALPDRQAEPSRYREPASSPRMAERPHISPTPFAPPPGVQPEPPPAATPPAPLPQPPATPKSPEVGNGVHVGPPPAAAAGEPLLHNAGGQVVGGMTSDQDLLTRRILEQLRNNPQDQQAHLLYQLLCYIKGEPVPQMDRLAPLAQEDREFFAALLDMLSNLPSVLRDSGAPSRRTKVLMEMVERLRAQAELTIPTLALCSRVSGFGVYEPMTTRFIAGTDHPVIVYCEVENFLSKLNERQMWETKLSLEVVIYTLDGVAIWSDGKNPVPPDISRNRRHDFFVIKHLTLPRTLALGRYVMKVSVVDENARRVAENNLEITLAAQ